MPRLQPIWLLCLFAVLDGITISVTLPVLRELFAMHGLGLQQQGACGSAVAFVSFLAAPLLGRAGDSFGRVVMLGVSAIAGIASSVAQALAVSGPAFVFARVAASLCKSPISTAQAYIVDLSGSDKEQRKAYLALIGMSFGLSFIAGPAIGGIYSSAHGPQSAFWLSAAAGTLSLLVLLALPEPRPHGAPATVPAGMAERAAETAGSAAAAGAAAAGAKRSKRRGIHRLFAGPRARVLAMHLHVQFVFSVAVNLYSSSLAPYMAAVLGMQRTGLGQILSYLGIVAVVSNAVLVGRLLRFLGDRQLGLWSLLAMASAWVAWADVTALPQAVGSMTVLGVAGAAYQLVAKAALSEDAPPELAGTVMGAAAAVDTFARGIAMPLAGWLFDLHGGRVIGLLSASLAIYCAAFSGLADTGGAAGPVKQQPAIVAAVGFETQEADDSIKSE